MDTTCDWIGTYIQLADAICPDPGDYCWLLSNAGYVSTTFSTVGYTNLELNYAIAGSALDSDNQCSIEYSVDLSTYYDVTNIIVDTPTTGTRSTFTSWEVTVDNIPQLLIRIGHIGPSAHDCYFNELKLSADTSSPTKSPTDIPTKSPTNVPTSTPTDIPTGLTPGPTSYTAAPTPSPTLSPTNAPSLAPTSSPTPAPTPSPTPAPTTNPTAAPSTNPTSAPTHNPTNTPSSAPSKTPTVSTYNPTAAPSAPPTLAPSLAPSIAPSLTPSAPPTLAPSLAPSIPPSLAPTSPPTLAPSLAPSIAPSLAPTSPPTSAPSAAPSEVPSIAPSAPPSLAPSLAPSTAPSLAPSVAPSIAPSLAPSVAPSIAPSFAPSYSPTPSPTFYPTIAPTQYIFPALHLNQYGIDTLDLLLLINIDSKARWRKLLMLAADDTFSDTLINDKLYVDVYTNPKFEMQFIFDCSVELGYSACNVADIATIKYRFGDIFGLKYFESTSVDCVFGSGRRRNRRILSQNDMQITIIVSLQDYEKTYGISTFSSMPATTTKMEQILIDIGNITEAALRSTSQHTKIESLVISWESYDYVATDFDDFITTNHDTFANNIAARININGFTGSDIVISDGTKGTLPIDTSHAMNSSVCDYSTNNYAAFPIFYSKVVGTGNVVQIYFDRDTNLGNDVGNKNIRDVVVNYISQDLGYSVGAWQDPRTLLLFIGYGPSTVSTSSTFLIKDCVRDACFLGSTECNDQKHNTSIGESAEYTKVIQARISGPTYIASSCKLMLSGEMSIGPLGIFPTAPAVNPEYPLYRWNVYKQNNQILFGNDSESRTLILTANNMFDSGDSLNIQLITTWAQGMTATTWITALIAYETTTPAITVDGGLVHYVQYKQNGFVVFSITYDLCGSVTDDNLVVIEWQQVSQVEAVDAEHGANYTSSSIADIVGDAMSVAKNVTDLVIPMDELSPYHVYYYKVSVGTGSEYIRLEVMPPLVLNMGNKGKTEISIRQDTILSIKDIFVFPWYLSDDELSTYYSWSWSCLQLSDGYPCEEEFVPMDNVISLTIENRLLRGNEVYQYAIELNDTSYEISMISSYEIHTSSLTHVQIGRATSTLNINPLFQSFTTSINNVPASIISQSWEQPNYNLQCNMIDNELTTHGSLFSLNALNPKSCDLAYGSIQTMTYDAIFDNTEREWPNTASVEFNMYVNIPPFGGICSHLVESGYALSTAFNIKCKNWMYTHTADINYYHQSAKSSYLRYSLKLVSPSSAAECTALDTVDEENFATYSDIQSTCIGMVLSYDKYSGIVNDLYLGSGQHILVSEIEDRITATKASYILERVDVTINEVGDGGLSINDVTVWFNRYNSQKVFAFIIALSYSLNDSLPQTFFDYTQLKNWDQSISKTSSNLKQITLLFYQQLKDKNMVIPKVTIQYFDTLYCIAIIHLKTETENELSDIMEWADVIDQVYTDYISYHENDNIEYDMTTKALHILQILIAKMIDFEATTDHISTLYSLLKLANRIGYNALYDSIPSQYVKFALQDFSLAITKVARNKLSQCHDLLMDIQWPSDWDESENVSDESYLSCIMISINASASITAATPHMNMLSVFDLNSSDRYQLTPIQLSAEDADVCSSISFNTYADNAFTATLSINQDYITPKCVSVDIYASTDNGFNWDDENCQVSTYDQDMVRCACKAIEGSLFVLDSDVYGIGMGFSTETDIRGFTGNNLAIHPTALIVMIFLIFIYGLGFYWIADHDENLHIPLLARPDIVFRSSRDTLFEKSSLKQVLDILYSPTLTTVKKVLSVFVITIRDYHLLLSIQWSNPYTNVASVMRLTIFMIYCLTMFWLASYFYGTNNQSHWAVAWCVNETDYKYINDAKYCSDVAMAFIYSLFACIPAYFFFAWLALIRPYSVEWKDESMPGIIARVKEKTPLWETQTILNMAKAIFDEAQEIRSKFFFSGQAKQQYLDLDAIDDDGDGYNNTYNNDTVEIDASQPAKRWSDMNTNELDDLVHLHGASSFGANMGNAAGNLQTVEDDILNEMMYPPQSSMNAPKPMYNQTEHNIAINKQVIGGGDEEEEDAEEDEDNDDDDEKDILLGITPGGPDDVTPGGPEDEKEMEVEAEVIDIWVHWRPVSEEEKDLQFEIAAALIDKSNIDMAKAMEKARQKIIEMKKNNQPLAVPASLSQRRASEIQSFGPAAQSAARKKAKQQKRREKQKKQKKEKELQEKQLLNGQDTMQQNRNVIKSQSIDENDDDDAYQMQAKIMAQIQHQHQRDSVENNNNKLANLRQERENAMKELMEEQVVIKVATNEQQRKDKAKVVVSVIGDNEYESYDEEKEARIENQENKEKMEKMEEIASQLREIELTRRRLLFTEYPFPHKCITFCLAIIAIYFCLFSLLCIYYGLSFDSTQSTVNIKFDDITSTSLGSRRLLQDDNGNDIVVEWSDINWTQTLYDDDDDCQFVTIDDRIQNRLESLVNNDSVSNPELFIAKDSTAISKSSISEDIRWIIFSMIGVLIGLLIWQPLISLIIAAIWLFFGKYNEQIILNIFCCNLMFIYRSIICRQLLYLCFNREYIESHVIDSLILCENDKKGNQQRLANRQQYYLSLNINGEIIDYGEEFNEKSREWHNDKHNHHKSLDSDNNMLGMHANMPSLQISQDLEFDDGNLSDDELYKNRNQNKNKNKTKKKHKLLYIKRFGRDHGFGGSGGGSRPVPVQRFKSDIQVTYDTNLGDSDNEDMGNKRVELQATASDKGTDMSVLHLFAIEQGISGQLTKIKQVKGPYGDIRSPSTSDMLTTPTSVDYNINNANTSIDVVKHSKKQSYFYIFEADYFPSNYLTVTCDDILKYCPLFPVQQSLFAPNEPPVPSPNDMDINIMDMDHNNNDLMVVDENEQMRLAIQQSLIEQKEKENEKEKDENVVNISMNDDNNNNNKISMEMVELQQSGVPHIDPMDDPSLQHLDSQQRRKAIKQRQKARDEAAFQESIETLPEMEKQKAIYLRIQAKNKRKKEKQKRRQKMLADPTANQVAQQHAILAQIEAHKAKQMAVPQIPFGTMEIDAPPAAFQYH